MQFTATVEVSIQYVSEGSIGKPDVVAVTPQPIYTSSVFALSARISISLRFALAALATDEVPVQLTVLWIGESGVDTTATVEP
jgi:hypothetical protein